MNRADFLAKIEWEGGVYDALVYGLKPDDLDEGEDDGLRQEWGALVAIYKRLEPTIEAIESYIEGVAGEVA